MKLLLIFVLVGASSISQIEAYQSHEFLSSGINDKLIQLIEKFKKLMINGNVTLGIPVLDPFTVTNQTLSTNSEIFSGKVKLNNLIVTGLSNFNVEKVDLKLVGLKLILGLKWSEIKLITDNYELNGEALKFIDFYGNGSLKINIENLNFSTTVNVGKKTDNTLFIKEMNSEVSLEDFQFTIDGIFNDKDLSDMTNAIATDLVPSVIKTYQKKLTRTINNVVTSKANKILSTMTLKDLLAIIKG